MWLMMVLPCLKLCWFFTANWWAPEWSFPTRRGAHSASSWGRVKKWFRKKVCTERCQTGTTGKGGSKQNSKPWSEHARSATGHGTTEISVWEKGNRWDRKCTTGDWRIETFSKAQSSWAEKHKACCPRGASPEEWRWELYAVKFATGICMTLLPHKPPTCLAWGHLLMPHAVHIGGVWAPCYLTNYAQLSFHRKLWGTRR